MSIYDEAIADAKALKKMAEQNAKNKVIEAITPKIRKLIEQKLNEEDEEVNLDLDALPEEDEESTDEEEGTEAAKDLPPEPLTQTDPVVTPPPSGAPESVSNTVTTKTAAGTEVKISVNVDEKNDSGGDITLNKESINALRNIISSNQKGITVGECRKQIRELRSLSKQITMKEAQQFMQAHAILLENCKKIKNRVINNNNKFLKEQYVTMIRELQSMSKQNKFRQLVAEMKKDIKEAKLVFDETDFGQGSDAEQMKEKFRNLSLGIEIADEDGEEDPTGGTDSETPASNNAPAAPSPLASPAPSQDGMSEFSDYEDEELEEMDEELEEMDKETSSEDDVMYEVNESLLKKELSRMRKMNESSKGSPAAAKMASSFGGGKAKGDPWADGKVTTEGSEENEDESSVSEAKKLAKKAVGLAKKAAEKAKTERKARVEEARKNHVLQKRLSEATKAAEQLKTQLLETNLFNAKLLYVNKLMQNRSLNEKQQRSIVEALDKAKTVRECKLLFESLNESITSKPPLNEARIPGSSSRAVQSGSTQPQQLNESADSDRWAILAGLKK